MTAATAAPDLTTYRCIHTALRVGAHRMAAAARSLDATDRTRAQAFGRYWRGYAGEVLAHHSVEDDIFFPALVAKLPAAATLGARTGTEHHELDELMATTSAAVERLSTGDPAAVAALADALDAVAAHMDHHLDFEDAELLPLVAAEFTTEEFDALEDQAKKAIGIGAQAAFTVPFVAASVTPEERDHLLRNAPLPFRILYRLTRRRHARLDAAALAGAAPSSRSATMGT